MVKNTRNITICETLKNIKKEKMLFERNHDNRSFCENANIDFWELDDDQIIARARVALENDDIKEAIKNTLIEIAKGSK